MSLSKAIKAAWRKNVPELAAWWSGQLPPFVTAARPASELDGIPVFCYHLVEQSSFAADLRYLQVNGYRTLDSREFIAVLDGRREMPDRAVLLTFDDGPRNFFDVAYPELARYEARAIAFIAPGLHAASGAGDAQEARPMTWQEMAQIHASGLVEFQSHTYESRFVPGWPAPAALAGCEWRLEQQRRGAPLPFAADLAKSREVIEAHLPGRAVDQLAFPQYFGTEEAVAAARALGFRACYWGLVPGRPLNRRGDSPYAISRISDEFLRRLPGKGRASVLDLLRERVRRINAGRAWRRRFEVRDG